MRNDPTESDATSRVGPSQHDGTITMETLPGAGKGEGTPTHHVVMHELPPGENRREKAARNTLEGANAFATRQQKLGSPAQTVDSINPSSANK